MGYRILAADDEISVRRLVESALNTAEYDVKTASSGQQLFQLLDEFSFDLVVLDLVMPGMDGLDVCRRIRQR